MLVAAVSGRALAAAARRAGIAPLVADLFADLDTREIADDVVRVAGSLARGLRRAPLLDALDRLAAGRSIEGVVYGSGFEDRPALLEAIDRHHVLLGNRGDAVARLKDPFAFAALCARAGIPHPDVSGTPVAAGEWLEKRMGASGGGHIWPGRSRRRATYYQRRVEGRPVSALFLADGRACVTLGFSEQWTDPAPGRPFRYGGAVRPATVSGAQVRQMDGAVARVVAAAGPIGLCSADFLLRPDGFDLIEINPRPGATLDIYRDVDGSLFRLHVDACRGRLPDAAPSFPRAAAAAVVYARTGVRIAEGFKWPEWTADRQPPGEPVPAGAPLCTVVAEADNAELARRLVEQRGAAILALAGAGS